MNRLNGWMDGGWMDTVPVHDVVYHGVMQALLRSSPAPW